MKRIILFYALVCTVWSISAQSHKDIASVDSLATRVERFGTGLPQEKVYLHIDNTCYFVRDTIQGVAHRLEQNHVCGTAHTGRLSRGTAATEDGRRNGTRGVHPDRLALCRILRTAGIHPVDAQLRTTRASAFKIYGGYVLQQTDGQRLLPGL